MFARGVVAMGVGAVLSIGGSALACWDGSSSTVGKVTFQDFDTSFDVAHAAHNALWLARIDRLLPADATLTSEFGYVSISLGDDIIEWTADDSLERLFDRVAKKLHVPFVQRLAAKAYEPPALWTIQAGTFKTQAMANARAERINESGCTQGFMEAGGFPADNPATMIEAVETPSGTYYRVNVGLHLSREAAVEAQSCLGETEVASMVRTVTWPAAYE